MQRSGGISHVHGGAHAIRIICGYIFYANDRVMKF